MKHGRVVLGVFLMISSLPGLAKSDGTKIGRFFISQPELAASKKTFVNDTKHHLVLRYTVKDEHGYTFTQEPIIKRGEALTIDFGHVAAHFSSKAILDHSLELLKVKQLAVGAGIPLVTTKLKDGALALSVHKNKFLENGTFSFLSNKNNVVFCKADKKQVH
jgi:hypothetical protein